MALHRFSGQSHIELFASCILVYTNIPAFDICLNMGVWPIDTAVWRNVCLHTKHTVFYVRKHDKLHS